MKDGIMKTRPNNAEPFAFQLVRQFLPAMEDQEEEVQPISDREFYSILVMIIVALVVLYTVFHGLTL